MLSLHMEHLSIVSVSRTPRQTPLPPSRNRPHHVTLLYYCEVSCSYWKHIRNIEWNRKSEPGHLTVHDSRGVMHSEVSWPGEARTQAQWDILARGVMLTCTVKCPGPRSHAHMHSETSWPEESCTRAQWGILSPGESCTIIDLYGIADTTMRDRHGW